ncbi:MAG TPA: holo-ACP synthase [Oculatellaceae cyanobacterium]
MLNFKIGTDIVSLERIERAYSRFGTKFLDRILTPAEKTYVLSRNKGAIASLAGRFAAKEACSKMLGTGWHNLDWKEVEVVRLYTGAPQLKLHGRAKERAERLGLSQFELSISHEREFAVAFVVACGNETRPNHV